jgi:hypothetical protein
MSEHQARANIRARLRNPRNPPPKRRAGLWRHAPPNWWSSRFGKRRTSTRNDKSHKLVKSATSAIRQLEAKLGAARR